MMKNEAGNAALNILKVVSNNLIIFNLQEYNMHKN
jgi:hypothetical protein